MPQDRPRERPAEPRDEQQHNAETQAVEQEAVGDEQRGHDQPDRRIPEPLQSLGLGVHRAGDHSRGQPDQRDRGCRQQLEDEPEDGSDEDSCHMHPTRGDTPWGWYDLDDHGAGENRDVLPRHRQAGMGAGVARSGRFQGSGAGLTGHRASLSLIRCAPDAVCGRVLPAAYAVGGDRDGVRWDRRGRRARYCAIRYHDRPVVGRCGGPRPGEISYVAERQR